MKKRMIVFDILLCLLLTLTGCVFTIRPIVVKTISHNISGVAISHQYMDIIWKEFPNASTANLSIIQDKIAESSSVERITNEYIQQIIQHQTPLTTNGNDIQKLSNEVFSITEKNIGETLSGSQKLSLKASILTNQNDILSQVETTIGYFGSMASNTQYRMLFQLYAIMTSLLFQLVCCLCCIGCLYLLIRFSSFKKALQHIAVCLVCSAFLLYVCIPYFAESIFGRLANQILGRTTLFDFSYMKTAGIIFVLVAIIIGIFMITQHQHHDVDETIHLA